MLINNVCIVFHLVHQGQNGRQGGGIEEGGTPGRGVLGGEEGGKVLERRVEVGLGELSKDEDQ